jgi:hypothetical protein
MAGRLGTLNMACIGISLNNFFFSVNSLPWVNAETYQRRSLAPVRYAASTSQEMLR